MAPSSACSFVYASARIKIINALVGGRTAILGDTMTMLLMATVGFLGMAAAMLHSGHDLDFDNRQISGAYRSRWA
jgi:hypothetical protein